MDSQAIRTSAGKALGSAGVEMILARSTDPAFDPVSGGTLTIEDVQTWNPYGVKLNFNSLDRLSAKNRDGSLIQAGDAKVLLEALPGMIPQPNDTLTIAGELWQVIAVDDVSPAGVPLLFKCQVRK